MPKRLSEAVIEPVSATAVSMPAKRLASNQVVARDTRCRRTRGQSPHEITVDALITASAWAMRRLGR